jgi:hypothetical protein
MAGNGHGTSGPGIMPFPDSGPTLEDRRIGGPGVIRRSSAEPKLREPLTAYRSPVGGGGSSPA